MAAGQEDPKKAAEGSGRLDPEPINRGASTFQGLLVAVLALLIAAAAVTLFSIIQTAVPCEFKPVTYAIFTGIVLAAVGSALGGKAAATGNFSATGIRVAVTGGAAFLMIVMGAVWFITRTDCESGPTLKLSSIPIGYSISKNEPTESAAHLRIRFDPNVRISEYIDSNLGYSIYFASRDVQGLSIHVDLIEGNKSAQICNIVIKRAPQSFLRRGLLTNASEFIALDRSDGVFELKFRQDFIAEALSKYHFDRAYDAGNNACIQIDFFDQSDGHTKSVLVNEIYFADPSLVERLEGISFAKGDLSSLLGDFKLYAVRAALLPNAVTDIKNDVPVPNTVTTTLPPTSPNATCITGNSPSNAVAALETLKQTGVSSDPDVKSLFEHWCEVEGTFYDTLKSSDDATLRYRLIRFIRSSITAVDVCWASNDSYRVKSATSTSCGQRLDRPRDLSRPLPFARTSQQKTTIVGLLRDSNVQVRHEAEVLLRLYPHDEFGSIFDTLIGDVESHPQEYAQSVIPAAVSYYYNRIVEQEWAETIEKAAPPTTAELARGLKWVSRLPTTSDRAISHARLYYAKANVLVQVTGDKSSSAASANDIKVSFLELLKLSPDDLAAYPFPHHLARAFCYVSGTADEARRFDTYNIDGFERVSPSKTVTIDPMKYEMSLRTLPDTTSTALRQLTQGEIVRILMTRGGERDGWQFGLTKSGLGWIRPKNQ